MKAITLKIHGRDVEFTDEPPTRPGAYWWTFNGNAPPRAFEVYEHREDRELMAFGRGIHGAVGDVGGLWSAPLVTVTEVERAYDEGYRDGDSTRVAGQYANSRARRVVEGVE